jgi:hypothetical protein
MTVCRCDNELVEGNLEEVITPLKPLGGERVEFVEILCGRCSSRRVYPMASAPSHIRQFLAATNPMKVKNVGIF